MTILGFIMGVVIPLFIIPSFVWWWVGHEERVIKGKVQRREWPYTDQSSEDTAEGTTQ